MYRKCATERSTQNQRALENAFLTLMEKLPYDQITITQICEEAGISRRVFYHLFGNKQDALYGLIDHRIMDIESFRTDISNMALRFFLYWKEQKPLLDAIRENNLWYILLERMIGSILREDYDVWRWLQAEDPENRQDILIFNISGCMALVFSWHDSGYQKPGANGRTDRRADEQASGKAEPLKDPGSWRNAKNWAFFFGRICTKWVFLYISVKGKM